MLLIRPGFDATTLVSPVGSSPIATSWNGTLATGSPSPNPSVAVFEFVMTTFDGARIGISVVDQSHNLLAAREAKPDELRFVEPQLTGLAALLPGAKSGDLIVAWIGGRCDLTGTVAVEESEIVVAPGPHPGCDASAAGRAIVLTFSGSLPTNLTIRYVPGRVF
ncbi:MAG TPA: hypothetical protein VIM39_07050 [Candidatus Limnocylindrales bacterium]